MAGMVPDVWGPMAWRAIHGAAHRFDTNEGATARDADLFVLFLLRLAFVLPCVHCRDSYVRFLAKLGAEGMVTHFQRQRVREFAVTLHNLVNAKLGKPHHSLRVAVLRDKVWSVGFCARDFVGLLLIVALNYVNNGEADKQRHYRLFFHALPDFALAIDEPRLAAALEHVREVTDGVRRRLPTETYQDLLVAALHKALLLLDGASAPPIDVVIERYNLCRSG